VTTRTGDVISLEGTVNTLIRAWIHDLYAKLAKIGDGTTSHLSLVQYSSKRRETFIDIIE